MSHTRESEEADGLRQVRLDLWHPGCWTTAVTEALSDTHVVERSLYPADDRVKGDFTLVSTGSVSMDRFVAAIDDEPAVEQVTVLERSADRARVVVTYRREHSIVPAVVNAGVMPVEPLHVTDGVEHWTVLVDGDDFPELLSTVREEGEAELRAIEQVDAGERGAFADPVDLVHDELSARQRECLFEARAAGYYEWPREVTADDIADDLGVSGPTLLDHLRRGEQTVLHAVLDELRSRYDRHR